MFSFLGSVAESGNYPTLYNPISCIDPSDDSSSNITASGGKISLIVDRSGNGYDFVMNTGSLQPDTSAVPINSLPTISFVGNDRLLQTIPTSGGNLTIISVFRPNSNNSLGGSFLSADSTDNDFQIDSKVVDEYWGRVNTTNLGGTTPPDLGSNQMGNVILTTYRFSTADSEVIVRLNGTQTGSDTYDGSLAASLLYRLAANRDATAYLRMDLGETIIFNQALTDTQITTIETYLKSKWGIA